MAENKLYDMAFLNKVSGGDKEFIREMITTFSEVGPEYVIAASQLLKEENYDTLSKETHRLIPGVSFLGAKKLEHDLMHIEEYTKKKTNLELVPDLLDIVIDTIHELVETLNSDFSEEQ